MNHRLAPRMEEVRSLVRDGYIPNVRLLLCNNGQVWNEQAQQWINNSGLQHQQVQWQHFCPRKTCKDRAPGAGFA